MSNTVPPTAPTTSPPPLSELVIGHAGLGPVLIGVDLNTLDVASSIFVADPVDCGEGDVFVRWRANYPDRPLGNELRAFEAGSQPDSFSYVEIYATGPHTEAGIEVGDAVADLTQAYPELVVGRAGAGRQRYLLYGSPANLFFDVAQADAGWPVDTITAIGLTTSDPAPSAPSYHPPGSC